MSANDAVKSLYERFPYPRPVEDLSACLEGKEAPAWNPRDSHALYFPEKAPRESLDVLIAGCGTNTGPQHAAALPKMRFTAIDISESSLAHARRVSEKHGLKNIEFFQLPIERVAELGRTFDFVSCHGVLHHLEDPVAALKLLAQVTRPDGAMSLMVYGRYGRSGLYMLQELFRDLLQLNVDEQDVTRIQEALLGLPAEHPFRIVHRQTQQRISLEEIADMLLHPRDRPYAVSDVRALVEGAGLQLYRWLGQAHYSPEVSSLAQVPALRELDDWKRAAALELFYGTILKHELAVRPAGCPSPQTLFTDERMPSAIPVLSPHLRIVKQADHVVLSNNQHQIPFAVTLPLGPAAKLLTQVDGRRTVEELAAETRRALKCPLTVHEAGAFFRTQFLADVVFLRAGPGSKAASTT